MKPLSELEAAVLGDVKRNQPCTAHFIRTRFRESPTSRFSDSAGSIYPLMKRLAERKLVASRSQRDGRRDVCYYSCTSSGLDALRKWIGPPIEHDVTQNYDPLRTRILYLEYLKPAKRAQWLKQSEQILKEKLVTAENLLRERKNSIEPASEFLILAHENATQEVRMRLKWLGECRRRLRNAGLLAD